MVKAAKSKAGAKSAGFCMYLGPSIIGTIQQARILYGDKPADRFAGHSRRSGVRGKNQSQNTRQSALCELSQAGRPAEKGGVTIEAWRICQRAENKRFDACCR